MSYVYEEQIMSKNKYPSIFSPQMEAIVFIIFQIFFATRSVLKTREYRDALRPIAHERKDLMDYKLGYLFLDIICSSKLTVFLELRSR